MQDDILEIKKSYQQRGSMQRTESLAQVLTLSSILCVALAGCSEFSKPCKATLMSLEQYEAFLDKNEAALLSFRRNNCALRTEAGKVTGYDCGALPDDLENAPTREPFPINDACYSNLYANECIGDGSMKNAEKDLHKDRESMRLYKEYLEKCSKR